MGQLRRMHESEGDRLLAGSGLPTDPALGATTPGPTSGNPATPGAEPELMSTRAKRLKALSDAGINI